MPPTKAVWAESDAHNPAVQLVLHISSHQALRQLIHAPCRAVVLGRTIQGKPQPTWATLTLVDEKAGRN